MSSVMCHLRVPARLTPLVVVLLSACASLLPSGHHEVVSPWGSYEEAAHALQLLQPYITTRSDVHARGLDPRMAPMVKVLHLADVLQHLSPAMLLRPDEADRGIRDCWRAGKRCTGYAVSVRQVSHERVGNFWLDALNFRRITVTTGWTVEALMVFVDDELVYVLVGGQPTITDREDKRNPLGPLQSWGSHLLE